ncbi:hypothetical protein [Streptomyces sp. AS02]|uniref:hypothetical protein n=1 Tax=Streptomyces sp. AS02 TaxID=2938946 RepID=UPI00202132C6|nr:hypothetical protein [Streptomyces sp. AS02]MCL8013804.1 hypothetical protein [Streptomyces sp. AS02]
MGEQKFTRSLLSLDRFQQRLAEFMLGRYLEFDFSGDSEDDGTALIPQALLDVVDGAPRVTLHHGITWMDLTRDPEPNEYRLAVPLAFTRRGSRRRHSSGSTWSGAWASGRPGSPPVPAPRRGLAVVSTATTTRCPGASCVLSSGEVRRRARLRGRDRRPGPVLALVQLCL